MAAFKDNIDFAGDYGLFEVELIGGIDYVASALGVSNAGGTLQDPLIGLFDSSGNLLTYQDDSFALGSDPLLQFRAPTTDTYYFAVVDADGGTGSYTFSYDQAGAPVFFGGTDSFGTFGG